MALKQDLKEGEFTREIMKDLRETYPNIVLRKHSDRYNSGVADIEVAWQGVTSWVEIKVLTMPAKERTTIPLVTDISKVGKTGTVKITQYEFLKERWKQGVSAGVLFIGSRYTAMYVPFPLLRVLNSKITVTKYDEYVNVQKAPWKRRDRFLPWDFSLATQNLHRLEADLIGFFGQRDAKLCQEAVTAWNCFRPKYLQ